MLEGVGRRARQASEWQWDHSQCRLVSAKRSIVAASDSAKLMLVQVTPLDRPLSPREKALTKPLPVHRECAALRVTQRGAGFSL